MQRLVYLDDVDVSESVYRLVTEEVPVRSGGEDRLNSYAFRMKIRVADPYSFDTDPDPVPVFYAE